LGLWKVAPSGLFPGEAGEGLAVQSKIFAENGDTSAA
jgi:hypothetical protein